MTSPSDYFDVLERLMAKKYAELRVGMSQAAREKSEGMTRQMLAELPLNDLRKACGRMPLRPIQFLSPGVWRTTLRKCGHVQ